MTAEHDKQGATHGQVKATAKDDPRVTYTPHQDATPEEEIRVLALAYRYVLECAEPKKASEAGTHSGEVEVGHAGGPPKERSADEGSSA